MTDPISMLLDENSSENIVLYNEDNEPVEFQQFALISLADVGLFTILRPVDDLDILAEDEALVFEVLMDDEGGSLEFVTDDAIVNQVFEEYYALLREEGIVE